MNKRGINLINEEVLKIIVAVLCIVALFYLASSLFGVFNQKSEVEQAKATLQELEQKIKGMQDGVKSFVVTSPQEWYLVQYKKGEINNKECLREECICMCTGPKSVLTDLGEIETEFRESKNLEILDFFYTNEGKSNCEKINLCIKANNLHLDKAIFYDWVSSFSQGTLKRVNWISLFDLPKNLYITKNNAGLSLREFRGDTSILEDYLEMTITTREDDMEGVSVGKFLRQYMTCKLKDGKMVVPGLEGEISELFYKFPGGQRQKWKGDRHGILYVINNLFNKHAVEKGITSGKIAFHAEKGDYYEIISDKIIGEGCIHENSCKELLQEIKICDDEYKIYFRYFA